MTLSDLMTSVRSNAAARKLLGPVIRIRRHLLGGKGRLQGQVVGNLRDLFAADPVLRVEEFGASFAMDPRSNLFSALAINKCYEPMLARECARLLDPDRDAIDVGANIGFYTVHFARLLGPTRKVLAVEPTANALRRLEHNIALNGVGASVEIFKGAACDRPGPVSIKTIEGNEEYSSLGEMVHPSTAGKAWTSKEVEGMPIDLLVETRNLNPGFIKIDVEGAEHLVLRGARRVLEIHRPVVLSELSDTLLRSNGSSAAQVVTFMKALGYCAVDPIDPGRSPGIGASGDVLFTPCEGGEARPFLDSASVTGRGTKPDANP